MSIMRERSSGEVEVKKCYVAMLDILGFKDMVREEALDKLVDFFQHHLIFFVNYSIQQMTVREVEHETGKTAAIHYEPLKHIKANYFSDTIIFWSDDDSLDALKEMCLATGMFMFYALDNGDYPLLVRGAITLNENYIDPDLEIYVGEGIVEAYEYANLLEFGGIIIPHSSAIKIDDIDKTTQDELILNIYVPTKKGNQKFAVINCFSPIRESLNLGFRIQGCMENIRKIKIDRRDRYASKFPEKFLAINRNLENTEEVLKKFQESLKYYIEKKSHLK